jgi:hypothetical protein
MSIHILISIDRNQLILRLAEMHVVSEQTGEKVAISVQQKIPLAAPAMKKAARRAATVQPTPRHRTSNSLNQDIEAMSTDRTMRPPPLPLPGNDVPRSSSRLEDIIKSQQKDIDRIVGAVARIEKDMDSFKEFMVEMRAELEANRATRKTQQDSNQEQLAWLQEDLKELRQESGNFQLDLREEELPDIRNQLDQLRQEIDAQEQSIGLPKGIPPPALANEFQREVLDIRRKCNEVDGLKAELQRLQKRLKEVEEKRQESFVFPRTLMTPNQSSHAGSRLVSMPTIAQQRPQMMLQGPEDNGTKSTMTRHLSPTRNPPGAFPDSIVESGPTPGKVTAQATTTTATSTSARIHRTVDGRGIAHVAGPPTSTPMIAQRWSYAKLRHYKTITAAFEAFGLEYPKLGLSQSIKILEDHVNCSNLQNTVPAFQWGEVTRVGVNSEDAQNQDASEPDQRQTSPLKRKHGQVEGGTEEASSEALESKRGRPSRAVKMQLSNDNEILRSPSPSFSSPRSDLPGHHMALVTSQGSPELGRAGFQSRHGEIPSEVANGVQNSSKRLYGGPNANGRAFEAQSTSSKESKARPAHRHQTSRDEIGVLPLHIVPTTPASTARNTVSSPSANALLMTIESEEAVVPGAFPNEVSDGRAVASNAQLRPIVFDPHTDTSKHFKCGTCGKGYRTPTALRYVRSLYVLSFETPGANSTAAQTAFFLQQ